MAELAFNYKGVSFTVKDVGTTDCERLEFCPTDKAKSFALDLLYAEYERDVRKDFLIDGKYCGSIDPTDNWSRRRDFAKSIGARIIKYVGVKYPDDAIF